MLFWGDRESVGVGWVSFVALWVSNIVVESHAYAHKQVWWVSEEVSWFHFLSQTRFIWFI